MTKRKSGLEFLRSFVEREGSIAKASRKAGLSSSTLSKQLRGERPVSEQQRETYKKGALGRKVEALPKPTKATRKKVFTETKAGARQAHTTSAPILARSLAGSEKRGKAPSKVVATLGKVLIEEYQRPAGAARGRKSVLMRTEYASAAYKVDYSPDMKFDPLAAINRQLVGTWQNGSRIVSVGTIIAADYSEQ